MSTTSGTLLLPSRSGKVPTSSPSRRCSADAESTLRESRAVFASLKAQRFIPEVDALLEKAIRLSS
jgi:hypothetical protein